MRRQILEGQHVVVGQATTDSGSAAAGQFAKGLQHRDQVFRGAVVGDHDNQRAPGGLLQQDQKQSFGGGDQSRDTNPPRALFQMGGHTREAGNFSTSVKRSRTKGRTMHFDFNRGGEVTASAPPLCALCGRPKNRRTTERTEFHEEKG